MILYQFECEAGHGFEEFRHCGDVLSVVCQCGAPAKKVMSLPQDSRRMGSFDTREDTAAYGGEAHVQAMDMQREHSEWLTAIGAADGAVRLGDGMQGRGRSKWAHPTTEGIAKKKDAIKHGAKPPESVTFGLKSSVVEAIGR